MSGGALALALGAATLHAGWNALLARAAVALGAVALPERVSTTRIAGSALVVASVTVVALG